MGQKSFWLVFYLGVCVACGGGRKEAEVPVVVHSAEPSAVAGVVESVDTPLTQLERAEVIRTVEAGLGQFLQEVELQESTQEGKFEGFRIVRFTHPARWSGVGLQIGDVIVRINDAPIERPEQAYAVFVSLKSADALEVSYLREGKAMRLSLPIVGQSTSPAAGAKTPAPAPVSSEAKGSLSK